MKIVFSFCQDVINKPPPDVRFERAFSIADFSNVPMNRLAYKGAIRVPIAVPRSFKKVLVVEIEVIHSKDHLDEVAYSFRKE